MRYDPAVMEGVKVFPMDTFYRIEIPSTASTEHVLWLWWDEDLELFADRLEFLAPILRALGNKGETNEKQ